jgi:hypothetical protein
MRRISHVVALLFVCVAATATSISTASAAPPPNDARSAAQALGSLPANVRATTAEATLEADEPESSCGREFKNSVWFGFTATANRGVLAALDAAGDMDAVVEVFERQRSQVAAISCDVTNRRGEATVDVDARAGTAYLVRVAPLANSVADAFRLRVVVPDEPAQPPGRALPKGGASATVDRFANPDDAWSVRMRKGRTYRINTVTTGSGCARVALYAPGSGGFDGSPARSVGCDRQIVYTPPESGRYTLYVFAPRASRARLPYRLRVGLARADDSAPGLWLADDKAVKGSLEGSELDALDLYRFDIERRSDLRIRLRTGANFQLVLLDEKGNRRGQGGTELERRVGRGRYFLAVRARDGADGSYVLTRITRTITTARTLANGARKAQVRPGASVALSLQVSPAVDGRATLLVERFDPLAGWLFDVTLRPAVNNGRAVVSFRPPRVGGWRVTGDFLGTRHASPSAGGTARFRVQG